MKHVAGDQFWCSGTDYQDRPDHEVGVRNCLFDRVTRRCERLNLGQKNIIELPQTVKIAVDYGYLCTQTDGHFSCLSADDAAADNDHICRRNTWNTAKQNAAAAVHFLKISGSDLNGHASRDLGHRRQERQTAIARDRFVSNAGYFAVKHLLGQFKFGSKMQVCEKQLIFTHTRIFRRDWLFDLDYIVS